MNYKIYSVKMKIFSKLIYISIAISIKMLADFAKIDKLTIKFIRKYKEPKIANTIFKKNCKVGECILFISKFPKKGMVINIM